MQLLQRIVGVTAFAMGYSQSRDHTKRTSKFTHVPKTILLFAPSSKGIHVVVSNRDEAVSCPLHTVSISYSWMMLLPLNVIGS